MTASIGGQSDFKLHLHFYNVVKLMGGGTGFFKSQALDVLGNVAYHVTSLATKLWLSLNGISLQV